MTHQDGFEVYWSNHQKDFENKEAAWRLFESAFYFGLADSVEEQEEALK